MVDCLDERNWVKVFSAALKRSLVFIFLMCFLASNNSYAWFDETHLAIARAAGYDKWFHSCGADMVKTKYPAEAFNHFVRNPPGATITAERVMAQVGLYNQNDERGHLYGAVIASLRDYLRDKSEGRYPEYHLAFCAHYVGDLSQPLHHTLASDYNIRHHKYHDGIINDTVLDKIDRIKIMPIIIESENDLAENIAMIASKATELGHRIEAEGRLLTEEEAYAQISLSASLLKAILIYIGRLPSSGD
ncbi:MAG: hypothetical protein C4582_05380 [Desulfobacteraceae bacterium]|jgi:hypothetical protein|nr:MAG: hypothetical protein C4582_05380 [Desulfobacteraceae bacterium]